MSHSRSVIVPVKGVDGFEEAGYGRIIDFHSPQKLGELIAQIKDRLSLDFLSVALPQSMPINDASDMEISSVALCAGSGGSMLHGLEVDLLFTGELSHHEALAAIEQGKVVITGFHSNTERGFLPIMQSRLRAQIKEQYRASFEVALSDADQDPFQIV